MNMQNNAITQERLKELFTYDPDTGIFTRKKRLRIACMKKVGSVGPIGYLYIGIDHKDYLAHRLAILYMTGEFPPKGMRTDHIDGNKLNNKYSNLRVVTHSGNAQNLRRASNTIDRTSKYLGVSRRWDGKKWIAQIRALGKTIRIGSNFESEEEAYQAYLSYKRILHEGNTL